MLGSSRARTASRRRARSRPCLPRQACLEQRRSVTLATSFPPASNTLVSWYNNGIQKHLPCTQAPYPGVRTCSEGAVSCSRYHWSSPLRLGPVPRSSGLTTSSTKCLRAGRSEYPGARAYFILMCYGNLIGDVPGDHACGFRPGVEPTDPEREVVRLRRLHPIGTREHKVSGLTS